MTSSRRALLLVVAAMAAALLMWAPDALACSVCFDVNEERRFSFLLTTLLLTFTPLAFVLGVVIWLKKRARETDIAPPAE